MSPDGIHPQIALQIRVRVIDPGVDHGHNHIARVDLSVPGLRGGNLRHVPLLRPEWIRWRRRIDMNHIVGFGVQHGVVSAITGDGSNWIWRWNHSRRGLTPESDNHTARMEGQFRIADGDYSDIVALLALSQKCHSADAQ